MKAAIYKGNKQFSIEEMQPRSLEKDEIRIEVKYCGICGSDRHIYHGTLDKRVKPPKIIGHEMCGIISELGAEVVDFELGTKVVVRPLDTRGEVASDRGYSHICRNLKCMGVDSEGAMQESWIVPAFTVHPLPTNTDMKIASLVEPLAVACHDIKMSKLQPDETVVIIGTGPIGLLIAMLAIQKGARVIAIEVNPLRLAMAQKLGCIAINPLNSNVQQEILSLTTGIGADLVFEVSGSAQGIELMTQIAAIRGRIVIVSMHTVPREMNFTHFFAKELSMVAARVYEVDDYNTAIAHIQKRDLSLEKLISSVYPLYKVQEAFESLDNNEKEIKILVDCQITS